MPSKKHKPDADDILRKYYEQYDDDTLESLKRYYNVADSDRDKFIKYVKNSRSPPAD
ncbi:MAG: hypothetical protein QXJ74_09120 [Nitrososphaera sp.]